MCTAGERAAAEDATGGIAHEVVGGHEVVAGRERRGDRAGDNQEDVRAGRGESERLGVVHAHEGDVAGEAGRLDDLGEASRAGGRGKFARGAVGQVEDDGVRGEVDQGHRGGEGWRR